MVFLDVAWYMAIVNMHYLIIHQSSMVFSCFFKTNIMVVQCFWSFTPIISMEYYEVHQRRVLRLFDFVFVQMTAALLQFRTSRRRPDPRHLSLRSVRWFGFSA